MGKTGSVFQVLGESGRLFPKGRHGRKPGWRWCISWIASSFPLACLGFCFCGCGMGWRPTPPGAIRARAIGLSLGPTHLPRCGGPRLRTRDLMKGHRWAPIEKLQGPAQPSSHEDVLFGRGKVPFGARDLKLPVVEAYRAVVVQDPCLPPTEDLGKIPSFRYGHVNVFLPCRRMRKLLV